MAFAARVSMLLCQGIGESMRRCSYLLLAGLLKRSRQNGDKHIEDNECDKYHKRPVKVALYEKASVRNASALIENADDDSAMYVVMPIRL